MLHDAAVVNGEVVLLVESAPDGPCSDPNTCIGSVWALWPDRTADAAAKIDEMIVWEAGYTQLSLAATGVVVGMKSAEVSSSPWSVAIPGATATPIDPVALGLEVDYIECSTCPSVAHDRQHRPVRRLDPASHDGPDRPNPSIVVKRLADGYTLAYDVAAATELPPFGSLDIGRLSDDAEAITAGSGDRECRPIRPTNGVRSCSTCSAGNEPVVIGPLGTRMAFGA